MGVIITIDNRPSAETVPDDALARILKLIPGPAAVAYTAAMATLASSVEPSRRFVGPISFVLACLIVVLVIWREGRDHQPPVTPLKRQYAVQLVAFWAWAFTIRNPVEPWWHVPTWIPALAVIFIPIFGALLLTSPKSPS